MLQAQGDVQEIRVRAWLAAGERAPGLAGLRCVAIPQRTQASTSPLQPRRHPQHQRSHSRTCSHHIVRTRRYRGGGVRKANQVCKLSKSSQRLRTCYRMRARGYAHCPPHFTSVTVPGPPTNRRSSPWAHTHHMLASAARCPGRLLPSARSSTSSNATLGLPRPAFESLVFILPPAFSQPRSLHVPLTVSPRVFTPASCLSLSHLASLHTCTCLAFILSITWI